MQTNYFQIFIITISAGVFLAALVSWLKGWASRREGLVWMILTALAAAAAADPELTTEVARGLGIGRGTDLVLYCAVVVMLLGFWMIYIRIRDIQRDLTLIVRQIALMQAEQSPPPPRPKSDERPPPHP